MLFVHLEISRADPDEGSGTSSQTAVPETSDAGSSFATRTETDAVCTSASSVSLSATDQDTACKNCANMHSQLEAMESHMLHLKMQHEVEPQKQLEPVVAGLHLTLKDKNLQVASLAVQTEEYKQEMDTLKCELDRRKCELETKEQQCAAMKRNESNLKRSAESAKRKKKILSQETKQKVAEWKELQNQLHQQLQTAREDFLQREQELKTQLREEQKEIRNLTKSLKITSDEKEVLQLQLVEQTTPVICSDMFSDLLHIWCVLTSVCAGSFLKVSSLYVKWSDFHVISKMCSK